MTLLQINRNQVDPETVVLTVNGDLDAFSVAEFRQALAERLPAPGLIIDLGATFLDSAGLHALVRAVRQVRERDGDAAVVCRTPRISRLLNVTGFDRFATLTLTIEEARVALRQSLDLGVTDESDWNKGLTCAPTS